MKTQDFTIRLFKDGDAAGIGNVFRSTYGENYPIKIFYDPQSLTDANRNLDYLSIVAESSDGKIVGVVNLFRSAPYSRIYECGSGLVLEDYRNYKLSTRLMDYLYNEWVPNASHVEEVFGEAVCNHIYMQRIVERMQSVETAIEIDLMPQDAFVKEESAHGRVASLLCFRCYKPKPHAIYFPEKYTSELHYIYSGIQDSRTILNGIGKLDGKTASFVQTFAFAQVARISILHAGTDLYQHIVDLENQLKAEGIIVFQVWLNMEKNTIDASVNVLRDCGYFFGGPLPRWFDGDGFLMQKIQDNPNFDEIVLYSDRSKEILSIIRNDWKHGRQ